MADGDQLMVTPSRVMTEQRTADGVELRERIDRYLRESGLAGPSARVVPLTGDASDRRYFRVIPADGPPFVLALHAGAIEFATLPFANVAELLRRIPLPVPACSAIPIRSASSRCRISAT